jgi:hypothetical protein
MLKTPGNERLDLYEWEKLGVGDSLTKLEAWTCFGKDGEERSFSVTYNNNNKRYTIKTIKNNRILGVTHHTFVGAVEDMFKLIRGGE